MSRNNSRPQSRRPRRSGGRGKRNPNDRRPVNRSHNRTAPAPRREEPKSLWQKIVAFFTGSRKTTKLRPGGPPGPVSRHDQERRRHKPEVVEVTSPRLFVGNLSFDATESDLEELFRGVGTVQSAEVVSHRDTQRSKGFAFVSMSTTDEAVRAVEMLHDEEFMGRNLVVSGAKANDLMDTR